MILSSYFNKNEKIIQKRICVYNYLEKQNNSDSIFITKIEILKYYI